MSGPNAEYEVVEESVNSTGWRTTTYRRSDGSEFMVSSPALVEYDQSGPTSGWFWDEDAHARMRDSVGARRSRRQVRSVTTTRWLNLKRPQAIKAHMARRGILVNQLLPYDDPERGWIDPMNEKETQMEILRFLRDIQRACDRPDNGSDA